MRHFFTPKKIILALIIIFIILMLYFYLHVFMPIILSFITALFLDPIISWVMKVFRFKKRLPAVIIVFTLFVCFVGTLIYLAITKVINEALKFIENVPLYSVQVTLFIDDLIEQFNTAVQGLPEPFINELEKMSDHIFEKGIDIAQQTIPYITGFAQEIPNIIIITIVYLITLFLFSMDLRNLKESFYSHFSDETALKVRYMTHRLGFVFIGFWKAQFLVSIVIFIVSYIGLLFISPNNALIMALLIWMIDFIPVIGSIAILSPWAIYAFITGNTTTGILLLILAAILLVIRRTLEPKIMGDHIGLSALSTLISIYLGLYFFGIIGLILGPLIIILFKSATESGLIRTDFKI